MKTSRKKSEFILSCTSNGVVINEKFDFKKFDFKKIDFKNINLKEIFAKRQKEGWIMDIKYVDKDYQFIYRTSAVIFN